MAEPQEGTKIEGEPQESHTSPQVASEKYEEKARKLHWAPLEEWRGDPEDWVPAKEFVQRQKLYDRIDSLQDAIKEWKQANKWFDDNTEMRDDAIAIGVGYAAKNPNKSEKEVYAYTSERIQRMYPEQFKKPVRKEEGEETGEEQPRRKQVANVE